MHDLPNISEAEWEVMKALWKRSPQTANELAVTVAPANDWNPLTVKTLINRLYRKKVIGRTKQGRAFLFHPLLQQADCAVAETESFLDRVFNGSLNPRVGFQPAGEPGILPGGRLRWRPRFEGMTGRQDAALTGRLEACPTAICGCRVGFQPAGEPGILPGGRLRWRPRFEGMTGRQDAALTGRLGSLPYIDMKSSEQQSIGAITGTPPSVDRVRMIRRSIRCGVFGLFGLIPVVGLGLAVQALRLHRQVAAESGESWNRPVLSWFWLFYWLIGLFAVCGYSMVFGFGAATASFAVFVAMYFCVQRLSFPSLSRPFGFWFLPLAGGYWVIGMLFMWSYGIMYGIAAATAIFLVFLALQSWQLWRTFPREPSREWNPAAHYLRAGAVLGYAGVFVSLGALGLAAIYFHEISDSL